MAHLPDVINESLHSVVEAPGDCVVHHDGGLSMVLHQVPREGRIRIVEVSPFEAVRTACAVAMEPAGVASVVQPDLARADRARRNVTRSTTSAITCSTAVTATSSGTETW